MVNKHIDTRVTQEERAFEHKFSESPDRHSYILPGQTLTETHSQVTLLATGHCETAGTRDLALTTQGQPFGLNCVACPFLSLSGAQRKHSLLLYPAVVLQEALSASPRSHSTPLLSGSALSPSPARPPRGAHVNDSNKYLIKAAGDAAARQSPLRAGRLAKWEGYWGDSEPWAEPSSGLCVQENTSHL